MNSSRERNEAPGLAGLGMTRDLVHNPNRHGRVHETSLAQPFLDRVRQLADLDPIVGDHVDVDSKAGLANLISALPIVGRLVRSASSKRSRIEAAEAPAVKR
jgi:hypothetical protein